MSDSQNSNTGILRKSWPINVDLQFKMAFLLATPPLMRRSAAC